MLRNAARLALLMTLVSAGAAAQDANAVIGNASKAMGADNLKSLTYAGSASTGNFGQSKTIAGPLAITTITNYTRAIDLTARVARHRHDDAAGDSGCAAAATGNLESERHPNQHRLDAATGDLGHAVGLPERRRGQQRDGPLATGRRPDVQRRVVDRRLRRRHPEQPYRLNGYINDQNMVERVETWVEHPVAR